MIHADIIQGTQEWFDIKRGKVSASKISDVMMKPTTAGYRNYRAKLVVERLTGETEDSYQNADMLRGTELEPNARLVYEYVTGQTVDQVGWIDHPTIEFSGSSPDGLVGEDGHIEIKCPKAATHLDTLLTGTIDDKYLLQMQFQMACSGRKWNDFVSYHPSFPEDKQLKIIRVDRDNAMIADIEKAVKIFLADVEKIVSELKG